jgi:ribosomal protein S18 acetylase RimI-like enzyme
VIEIREALLEDNEELQAVQSTCPQGTTLIVSIVNTPDFFARAKAYESYKVYVALEDSHIIGSVACALRKGLINGKLRQLGYLFQAFVSPQHRRKGVAKRLIKKCEDYFSGSEAEIIYCMLMESNLPSMRLFKNQDFIKHRTLVMPSLIVRKEMDLPSKGNVRPMNPQDFKVVAELLNETWQNYSFYEPTSADGLARFINRTPAYLLDNLLVFEDHGEIMACLGFWDWSQVMRVSVEALSLKMRVIGWLLVRARILPDFVKPGDVLKQIMLTPIGFRDYSHLAILVKAVNNLALSRGFEQIFCVCERNNEILKSIKGFTRIDTKVYLYAKLLKEEGFLGDEHMYVDGIDM